MRAGNRSSKRHISALDDYALLRQPAVYPFISTYTARATKCPPKVIQESRMLNETIWLTTTAMFTVAGLAMGFGMGWYARFQKLARSRRPFVSASGETITIENHLDENIRIVKIAVNQPFATNFRLDQDGSGEIVEHWYKKSRSYNARIAPRSEARLRLRFREGENPPVVTLTFNSDSGTLGKERVRVAVS